MLTGKYSRDKDAPVDSRLAQYKDAPKEVREIIGELDKYKADDKVWELLDKLKEVSDKHGILFCFNIILFIYYYFLCTKLKL